MSNVVTELLARVGEAAALSALMNEDMLTGGANIPTVSVRVNDVDGDKDAVFSIEDEPRRLALVPGFAWMWYNADGPEE
jgi:hypothetical protein